MQLSVPTLNIDFSEAEIVGVICKIFHDPDVGVEKLILLLLKTLELVHGLITFWVQIDGNFVTNYLRKSKEEALDLLLDDKRHGP